MHVKDASRAVGVCTQLLSPELRDEYARKVREDYAQVRERHKNKQSNIKQLTLNQARANALKTDWATYSPPTPNFLGVKALNAYPLDEIAKRIDWTPFFAAWELHGKFPKILEDEVVGVEASKLYQDAQGMLAGIIAQKWLTANGVIGLYPANSVGDDIEIYTDETRSQIAMTYHSLRQQSEKPPGRPNLALADFVAPKGVKDYIGGFAVTAGINIDARVAAYEKQHDDYNAIMLKALADRLAEAFAELLHERVRREFWGYAADEVLSNEDMINEKYRGIRPAPGYPACPEHSEKAPLFDLLQAPKNAGITLTDSYAMLPTAAVSGFYFSHPESSYFAVGKIGRDQLEDYAQRKGWDIETAERWLAPNLP